MKWSVAERNEESRAGLYLLAKGRFARSVFVRRRFFGLRPQNDSFSSPPEAGPPLAENTAGRVY